jgi:hypothetical protein
MDKTTLLKYIFTGLIVLGIILAIVVSSVILKQNDYNKRCKDRTQRCLDIYNDPNNPYPVIKQNPIPNGGKYRNESFGKDKYYGLRDFFYAASYKSYLPCGYTNDVVSYNAIKNVLLKGARAIHLDIFFKGTDPFCDDASIIVGNVIDGELAYSECVKENDRYLDFMNCLELINQIAWSNSDAPLFLYLNMEFLPNTKLEYQIYSQLFTKCSDKLLDKYYGFQRINIGDIPVNMAINKLVILTNRIPINGFLNEITNGVMSENNTGVILYKITKEDINFQGIKTKFANKDEALKVTMHNMVAVIKESIPNEKNRYDPGMDSENYDASYHFELGISMTFMNWQKNPVKYLEKFKEGGMILKPPELIYIPQQKPPVEDRNTKYDYETTRVTGLNGFYDFDF